MGSQHDGRDTPINRSQEEVEPPYPHDVQDDEIVGL